MRTIRERTKDHVPAVLLTLLSIIQALSLEFLWSHLVEAEYLFAWTWTACLYWAQIVATFLGIVQIWIVYSSSAMRFRWVPRTSDSIFPFLIGLTEFALIENLGPGGMSNWLIGFALVYALMTVVDHSIMKRARRDPENAVFFSRFKPATLRDFLPSIAVFTTIAALGVAIRFGDGEGYLAMAALVGVNLFAVFLISRATMYWNDSVAELCESLNDSDENH